MPRYQREDIVPGAFITLDATGVGPVFPTRTPPRAPRYGDPLPDTAAPDFKAISERLDAARERLEQIAREFRDARART